MRNQEVAEIFYKIADILEIQGVQWKPRAYRAAASSIELMPMPLAQVYKEGGLKALDEIPAVGEIISRKIEELLKTGKLRYFEKLKKEIPIDLALLDAVPGLGPKKLRALHQQLSITTLLDLKKAAEKHQVVSLSFIEDQKELIGIDELKKYCKVETVKLPKYRSLISTFLGLFSAEPLRVHYLKRQYFYIKF